MRHNVFYFLVFCLCSSVACKRPPAVTETERTYDEFEYPFIQTKGKKLSDFVPPLWNAKDTIYKDLNEDGKTDALLLLTYNDTTDAFEYPGGTMNYQLFEQRVLLILYKSKKDYALNTYCYKLLNFKSMSRGGLFIETEKGVLILSFEIAGNGMYHLHYTFEPETKSGRWIVTKVEESGGNAEYSMNASYNFKNDSLNYHSSHWNNDENDTTWTAYHSDLDTIIHIKNKYHLDSIEYRESAPSDFLPESFGN